MTYPAYLMASSGRHHEEFKPLSLPLSPSSTVENNRGTAALVMSAALGALGLTSLLIYTKNQKSELFITCVVLCTSSCVILTALAIQAIKNCKNEKKSEIV